MRASAKIGKVMQRRHPISRQGPAQDFEPPRGLGPADDPGRPHHPEPHDPEPPHDILAAEAFAVPAPDPSLRHRGPVKLPEDPTGIAEAHDILAAEEFAMPAPAPGRPLPSAPRAALAVGARSPRRIVRGAVATVLGAARLRRPRAGRGGRR
jgi:hypothetical protein